MPQNTVLLGFAEAMAAPEVVWSLVDAGFHVIAFARKGRASALRHSRHVTCHEICAPESDLQRSQSDLVALLDSLEINGDNRPPILFPLDDKALWLASRIHLRNGWVLAGPSGANAEFALNKCIQTQKARAAGFNVPTTALARTADDVIAFSNREPFPIILKASECVPKWQDRLYNCRKWIVANRVELDRALTEWGERVPLLVQPFVSGTGEGVFGLAAPDGVRAWSAHRRLRMMNPQGSGSSACISQAVSDDLKEKAEALLADVRWQGLFMIELLRDRSGQQWFVEFNGRPWGSTSLSRRQGLEYPAWHATLAVENESNVGLHSSSESGVVCRNAGREFMHLLFVLRGPKSKALNGWPSFAKAVTEVACVRSGETFYNWRREDPKVFVSDFWYTIKDNVFKSRN
jgi:hypothetical protein